MTRRKPPRQTASSPLSPDRAPAGAQLVMRRSAAHVLRDGRYARGSCGTVTALVVWRLGAGLRYRWPDPVAAVQTKQRTDRRRVLLRRLKLCVVLLGVRVQAALARETAAQSRELRLVLERAKRRPH